MTETFRIDDYTESLVKETYQIFPIGYGFGQEAKSKELNDPAVIATTELDEDEDETKAATKVVRAPRKEQPKANDDAKTKDVKSEASESEGVETK